MMLEKMLQTSQADRLFQLRQDLQLRCAGWQVDRIWTFVLHLVLHLSVMRQCIERAFGILVRRWGIFWRPLTVHFTRWRLVLRVCAKLHNLCVDRDVPVYTSNPADNREGDCQDGNVGEQPEVPTEEDMIACRSKFDNIRRGQITHHLADRGIVRPAYSIAHCKA